MKFDPATRRLLIRQSWLNTFIADPERARLGMLYPELDRDTDVASLGTGVHAALEQHLLGNLDVADMVAYAQHVAAETIADDTITWIDLTPETYIDHAGFLTQAWINDLSHLVPRGGQPEVHFEFDTGRTVTDPDGTTWQVWFEGTIDYIPPDPSTDGVWDWKTAGRSYQQWERQRWALQPSVYALAVVTEIMDDVSLPLDFHYGVMCRNDRRDNGTVYASLGKGQQVTIRRFPSHGDWVVKQAVAAAEFVLHYGANRPWPRNDQSALCSEKWCPYWSKCKGSHVSTQELTWKPS